MDQHNYLGFSTPSNDSIGYQATKPCVYWAMNYNNSMTNFGLSYSGEFSLAVNDCGVYLNNVGNGARFDGTYIAPGSTTPTFEAVGDCTTWNDWPSWDQDRKDGLVQVAYAHMDATQNWFMWTWKIGNSIKTGFAPNPMWHMKREYILLFDDTSVLLSAGHGEALIESVTDMSFFRGVSSRSTRRMVPN